MKNLNENRLVSRIASIAVPAMLCMSAFAADADLSSVTAPIVDLLNSLMTPLLAIVGSLGALYCVLLGVKFAKAEEPQEREKAKSHLKNAVIGFVLIFVLLLALKMLTPVLTDWVNNNGDKTNYTNQLTTPTAKK